jgi:acyl dehydratase
MSERLLAQLQDYVVAFEDFEVGDTFVTSGRTVTEADVVNFAGLSADYNALHVDAAFAATTPHEGRIAHGLLVLAIASGLCTRLPVMKFLEPSILGLADLHCRFRRPCRIGDTLKVRMTVTDKQPGRKPDRGTLTLSRVAVNQHGEDVMESVWQLVVRTRGSAS